MRWFTCTPRSFLGTDIFYVRDSGLTCLGLQQAGVESRAISLGPPRENDLAELIRADLGEMESPDWWRGHQLDGVVFYSWINPAYRAIADAIRTAGIRLVQVADTHGVVSPLADWPAHFRSAWYHHWPESGIRKVLRTALKLPYSHTLGILRADLPMVRMIDEGDHFLAATPGAAERFRRLARRLGGAQVADKVGMIPLPVSAHFRFDPGDEKADEVISVGRWDHPQKRVELLMATIGRAAELRSNTVFRIFGGITDGLRRWHGGLPVEQRKRVHLEGKVSNDEIALAYRRARVMLVTAAYEGCHNASAEAVCSGCSIVSPTNPFLCALDWHASRGSGRTIAGGGDPVRLAAGLGDELADWDAGRRDPAGISGRWVDTFHPRQVARAILDLFPKPE